MRRLLLPLACALALLPAATPAASWYWRPNDGAYGDGSGRSYDDAWSTEAGVAWARMRDGDTLFICGRHDTGAGDRGFASGRGGITISGACPGDPGEIISVGMRITPGMWRAAPGDGIFAVDYSGSPSSAQDEIGPLRLLRAPPGPGSPCRSYFHDGRTLYYRPCGPPQTVYPTGGAPVVLIRHDGVRLERLSIRNGGRGIEVAGASGVVLEHLHVWQHTGIGIQLTGRTRDGVIRFNEIDHVTDGIYATASGAAGSIERHDRWLVEGNFIHDVAGSGDSHGIGWQSGSDGVFRRNHILRAAGSGITIYAWRHQENARNLIEGNVIVDVVRQSGEANQRGIELSGDSCWDSPELRRGDVVRDNLIENAAEGIYAKAAPADGARFSVRIEGNRIRARETGIRMANAMGGAAPGLDPGDNVVEAPRRLVLVNSGRPDCR